MKTKFLRSLVLFAGLSALLTATIVDSWAQETTGAPPISVIKIKNVRAKMMEFWVAPRKKSAPVLVNEDKKQDLNFSSLSNNLPGLESVVAYEDQNELWVKGTPESIRNLREIVDFLDRPVKQLELKTQIVEVDAAEVAGIGEVADPTIMKNPYAATGPETLVFKAEFQDKIRGLLSSGKAKVLHASQTTVSNNSMARVSWDENPISQRIALQATPTIQHDKTVTLFLTRILGEGEVSEGKITATSFLTSVANVRAGDTIVLRLNDFETVSNNGSERVTLLLASARILED